MSKPKSDDIEKFHDYDIHLPTRTIYVGASTIDPDACDTDAFMAERLIKNIHMLDRTEGPINIVMNNMGGYQYSCMAIVDAILLARSHVTITGLGALMSAGSIIFQAADSRLMGPNCLQMLHYGSAGGSDHVINTLRSAAQDTKMNKWMEDWYLKRIREKHPKFSLARAKKLLQFDTWLTAEQSVALGLADEILGRP